MNNIIEYVNGTPVFSDLSQFSLEESSYIRAKALLDHYAKRSRLPMVILEGSPNKSELNDFLSFLKMFISSGDILSDGCTFLNSNTYSITTFSRDLNSPNWSSLNDIRDALINRHASIPFYKIVLIEDADLEDEDFIKILDEVITLRNDTAVDRYSTCSRILLTTTSANFNARIRSNCALLRFPSFSQKMILKKLEHTAELNGITIDEASIKLIAENSTSPKEAICILDKLIKNDLVVSTSDVFDILLPNSEAFFNKVLHHIFRNETDAWNEMFNSNQRVFTSVDLRAVHKATMLFKSKFALDRLSNLAFDALLSKVSGYLSNLDSFPIESRDILMRDLFVSLSSDAISSIRGNVLLLHIQPVHEDFSALLSKFTLSVRELENGSLGLFPMKGPQTTTKDEERLEFLLINTPDIANVFLKLGVVTMDFNKLF